MSLYSKGTVKIDLWGNIIGISLCLLQSHFHIIQLDPSIYYLDAVPIDLIRYQGYREGALHSHESESHNGTGIYGL